MLTSFSLISLYSYILIPIYSYLLVLVERACGNLQVKTPSGFLRIQHWPWKVDMIKLHFFFCSANAAYTLLCWVCWGMQIIDMLGLFIRMRSVCWCVLGKLCAVYVGVFWVNYAELKLMCSGLMLQDVCLCVELMIM